MNKPVISIDRKSKKWAIFDDMTCIGKFTLYTDEKQAEADARAEIAKHTEQEPEIVYPMITRMTLTRSRRS